MAYILLILGFMLLVKGADLFVSGSSSIAECLGIPTFIIGLTVVAFGTSMPEAAISVTAAFQGSGGMAVGNALGSNIFNLLVVLGVTSIIKSCSVPQETLRFEYPLSIIAVVVLLVISLRLGDNTLIEAGSVSRADGIILLTIFAVFMVITVKRAMREHEMEVDEQLISEKKISLPRASIISIIGLAAIVWGGDMVVDSAVVIAEDFGIDEILIGLTIVALGTSLPELVISVVAALKGETDIAVGNVIGSNIFNMLLVVGLSASIKPIEITMFSVCDIIILIGVSLIVFIPLIRNHRITRGWGGLMLVMYAGYLLYIIERQ